MLERLSGHLTKHPGVAVMQYKAIEGIVVSVRLCRMGGTENGIYG